MLGAFVISLVLGGPSPPRVEVSEFLNGFKGNEIELLEKFYEPAATFQDPFVSLTGRDRIRDYNVELFKRITDIRYEIESHMIKGNEEALTWTMYVRHKNIESGEWVHEKGGTYIRRSPQTGKVELHRDYFDTGTILYGNIPVLGWL